ncbi:MAG: hypothetical protein K9N11_06945 [Lentisphaeria bacterium]|nr:hypothetical protein [Candidatus Neomarinimicrobiota bacterium]MCF7842573.1 hypothetical protein [Lentisphaeria bacterium]
MRGYQSLKIGLMALVLFTFFAETARAIPAFARKYRMSCNTCHTMFPKLKDFGDEFAGNGFVMPGVEPSRAFLETGDIELLLQRELPVAVRMDLYYDLTPDAVSGDPKTDFRTPYNIKLLSGGNVGKNVSYYFYFFMSERGSVAGLEDAFIYVNDLFGKGVNVAIGQFQLSDPMFKRELRLSYSDYQVYRTTIGWAPTDLTYDRGLSFDYGAPFGTDFVFTIANGNGIGPASGLRQFDDDNYKTYLLRASHGLGNMRVGGFGYYAPTEWWSEVNTALMFGADATALLGRFEVNAQWLFRTDDNPLYRAAPAADKVKTNGGFVEAIYSPNGDQSKWNAILLYNLVNSDVTDLYPTASDPAYHAISVTGCYQIYRNMRAIVEYLRDMEKSANHLLFGISSAF